MMVYNASSCWVLASVQTFGGINAGADCAVGFAIVLMTMTRRSGRKLERREEGETRTNKRAEAEPDRRPHDIECGTRHLSREQLPSQAKLNSFLCLCATNLLEAGAGGGRDNLYAMQLRWNVC